MHDERRRLARQLFALVMSLVLALSAAQAATWRFGSAGEPVRTLQARLETFGYGAGLADGIYGAATEAAVRRFQAANGLTADGVAGQETLAALGIGGGVSLRDTDTALLARVISAEARGEPYAGQVAVGAVILNRVRHPAFPATVAGVVYQPGAFACMTDGQFEKPVTASSVRAAREALGGNDPSGGAVYYFNPAATTAGWLHSRTLIKVIGNHRFCE